MRVREYARARSIPRVLAYATCPLLVSSSSRDRSHLNLPMRCSPSRRRGRGGGKKEGTKEREETKRARSGNIRGEVARSYLFPVARAVIRNCNRRELLLSSRGGEEKKREREIVTSIFYPNSLEIVRESTTRMLPSWMIGKRGITLRSADVIYERVKETPRGNLSSFLFERCLIYENDSRIFSKKYVFRKVSPYIGSKFASISRYLRYLSYFRKNGEEEGGLV